MLHSNIVEKQNYEWKMSNSYTLQIFNPQIKYSVEEYLSYLIIYTKYISILLKGNWINILFSAKKCSKL